MQTMSTATKICTRPMFQCYQLYPAIVGKVKVRYLNVKCKVNKYKLAQNLFFYHQGIGKFNSQKKVLENLNVKCKVNKYKLAQDLLFYHQGIRNALHKCHWSSSPRSSS